MMSTWRRIAIEKLPECGRAIEAADSVGYMWIEVGFEFAQAHR